LSADLGGLDQIGHHGKGLPAGLGQGRLGDGDHLGVVNIASVAWHQVQPGAA